MKSNIKRITLFLLAAFLFPHTASAVDCIHYPGGGTYTPFSPPQPYPRYVSCILKHVEGKSCHGTPGQQWTSIDISSWFNLASNPATALTLPAHGATGNGCCIQYKFTPHLVVNGFVDTNCNAISGSTRSMIHQNRNPIKNNVN